MNDMFSNKTLNHIQNNLNIFNFYENCYRIMSIYFWETKRLHRNLQNCHIDFSNVLFC